ncbi:MAG: hypothetical protein GY697_04250 [Desulfobacterales bacterium]|nr:hypothetical protein [Desulfobacterales bacterium]
MSIERSRTDMAGCLALLQEANNRLEQIGCQAGTQPCWWTAHHMVTTAQLVTRQALARVASLGPHYRFDQKAVGEIGFKDTVQVNGEA